MGVVDTNCSPDGIDYIIPGNDDAARAVALYCELASRAVLDGMSAQLGAAGVDLGAMEDVPLEGVELTEPIGVADSTDKEAQHVVHVVKETAIDEPSGVE